MPTATLPRSAQVLTGAERPTLTQIRVLRRIAGQDIEERAKLAAVFQDGLPGVKDKARLGVLAYALDRFADAEEHLDPKDAFGQAILGLVYAELGELKDAVNSLTAAVKGLPEAKAELARVQIAAGELEDAEKSISGVTVIAERDFLQGLLLEAKGNVEGAIKAYESALEHQADHVESAFKIGVLLDRIGDDDLAEGSERDACRPQPAPWHVPRR